MPKGIYVRKLGKRIALEGHSPRCTFPGCNNPAMKSHKRKAGGWYCDIYCLTHHRKKYNMRMGSKDRSGNLKGLSSKPCEKCGWHEARCDLHRIIPGSKGGRYTKENVQVLCPNCHRLEHPERYSLENHQGRNR